MFNIFNIIILKSVYSKNRSNATKVTSAYVSVEYGINIGAIIITSYNYWGTMGFSSFLLSHGYV